MENAIETAAVPAARFLGTTDEVSTCDCCGRTGLKSTVALLLGDALDPVYYGVTCAAHALRRTVKEIRTGARDADRARERAAAELRAAANRAEDALWQAFLDEHAGTGADVRDGLGVVRIKQIAKLGGFTAARVAYTGKVSS